jgi:hypothetical protein
MSEVPTYPCEPALETTETKQELTSAELVSKSASASDVTPAETAQQEKATELSAATPAQPPAPISPSYDDPGKIIRFGDVIKLFTKSSYMENAAGGFIGFLEQKDKSNTQILVVPPVKAESHDRFQEAEFIVSSTRGENPIADGTPLNYKQPFVLKTSDEGGFSANNKSQRYNDVVTLRPSGVKGEMYVAFEKEGLMSTTTHVQNDDSNVTLTCVDSNRIRKKFNKNVGHFIKSKNDAIGGLINSNNKGQPLVFKVIKVIDKNETYKYIKNPDQRRASVEATQTQKITEVKDDRKESEDADATAPVASQEQQPVENNYQKEPTSSVVTPFTYGSTKELPAPAMEHQLETASPVPVVVKVTEPTEQPSKKADSDKSLAPVATTTELADDLPLPAATLSVVQETELAGSNLSTIELDDGENHTTTPGKLDAGINVNQQLSATAIVSEAEPSIGAADGTGNSLEDEQVETGCAGYCFLM